MKTTEDLMTLKPQVSVDGVIAFPVTNQRRGNRRARGHKEPIVIPFGPAVSVARIIPSTPRTWQIWTPTEKTEGSLEKTWSLIEVNPRSHDWVKPQEDDAA